MNTSEINASRNHSPKKPVRKKPVIDWFCLFLAVIVAIGMWYFVSVRERIEAQIEIGIDYFGVPPDLVVTSGLVNKITVRLRGPEALLRSILRQRLNYAIDLSFIKKGVTIVPLPGSDISPALRAFEVVDIQPPRIVVTADNLIERTVPVSTIVDSPLGGGALTVENISVSPATVILRGPEAVISTISSVPLTIPLDSRAAGTTIQQTMALDTPSLVTATPSSVRVRYTITSGRTVISRRCPITIAEDSTHHYSIAPKELNVLVEVPEALAKSQNYLKRLEISVAPPPLDPGEAKKTRVRFKMPDGMTLLNPINEEVTVTRLKQ